MTHLLVDTSVVIKWFHAEGESEVNAARALRDAHVRGSVGVHVIDLVFYELGNVLIRSLRWRADDVAGQFDDLYVVLGGPLIMTREWLRQAAMLADTHSLSFYDASWAAAALELGISLVSADRALVSAGLAETPTDCVARLRLG